MTIGVTENFLANFLIDTFLVAYGGCVNHNDAMTLYISAILNYEN